MNVHKCIEKEEAPVISSIANSSHDITCCYADWLPRVSDMYLRTSDRQASCQYERGSFTLRLYQSFRLTHK